MMDEQTLFVRDFMTPEPICIGLDMDILQAISLLLKHQISGAPVVDEQGQLVGMLTERDCIQVAVHAGYFDDFGGPVAQYMSQQVETVSADDNLMDIAQKFIQSSFRRYPVMEQGRLVGLITRHDILHALEQMAQG